MLIDHEHVRFAGPPLCEHLFRSYQKFFENCSVCESLKKESFYHLSRERVQKQTIRIIIGVQLCFLHSVKSMRRCSSIDLKTMLSQKGLFSDICYFMKEQGSLKRRSLFLRPSIICLSGEAKSSAAFLMSVRPSTTYGLRVYYINYF